MPKVQRHWSWSWISNYLLFYMTLSWGNGMSSKRPQALAHWGWDKIVAISQTTISGAFSWMKMYEFRFRFHLSLFMRFELTNIPALVQIMAWHRPGDKPLFEPMMVSLLMHICVTRPQWVKWGACHLAVTAEPAIPVPYLIITVTVTHLKLGVSS